ncbi:MAG: hypothetical protein QW542_03580 [Thermoproteota archaeon]
METATLVSSNFNFQPYTIGEVPLAKAGEGGSSLRHGSTLTIVRKLNAKLYKEFLHYLKEDWSMGVKTSFIIDEKTWSNFKAVVLNKYGVKKLSSAVEEALKTFTTLTVIEEFTENLGIKISYPSSNELKKNRPAVRASASAIVREMRNEREAHLLGLQRDS